MTSTGYVRRARAEGWTATRTKGGHSRMAHPAAAVAVLTSATPALAAEHPCRVAAGTVLLKSNGV